MTLKNQAQSFMELNKAMIRVTLVNRSCRGLTQEFLPRRLSLKMSTLDSLKKSNWQLIANTAENNDNLTLPPLHAGTTRR